MAASHSIRLVSIRKSRMAVGDKHGHLTMIGPAFYLPVPDPRQAHNHRPHAVFQCDCGISLCVRVAGIYRLVVGMAGYAR